MTDLDTLFRAVDALSTEEKQQLVEYIQRAGLPESQRKPRVFGLHPDGIWISEDFDDELPDSFWLSEA